MSHTRAVLDDGHIIVMTLNSDYDVEDELRQLSKETAALLDAGPDRVVIITDAREFQVNNFNQMLVGSKSVRSPETQQVSNHPKLIGNLTITNNKLVQTILKGLNTATFGYFAVTVFETMDEALNEARALLEGKSEAG
jgi:hypothetical protein